MNSTSTPQLCIVMPAYNEEGCIEAVVNAWLSIVESSTFSSAQLIVVNDGSKDRTGEILDNLAKSKKGLVVVHRPNGGHGQALLSAYQHAAQLNPEWIFHVDSDDQFVVEDFRLLWEKRDSSRFILGLRKSRHDPLHRLIITRINRLLILVLFGRYIRDANIPFRLIEGRYMKALLEALPLTVFAPNIFLSVLAAKEGQKLLHIPVQHKERRTGKISIVKLSLLKACVRSAKELYAFRASLPERLRVLRAALQQSTT